MKIEQVKYMIMAQNMKRAIQFYTKTFGLQLSFETEMWTEMRFGDAVIALHGGGDGTANATGLSFQVDDIQAACAAAKVAGAMILSGPEDREGEPIFLAHLRDTEGNEIMLSQYKGR